MFLIGYFNTLDKIKYGVDNKKRPYYGFTPFYGDYKKIKITYSGKQKGKLLAQIEIIKFDDFPTGRIINIIGKYDKNNIYNLILNDSHHKFIEEEINTKEIFLEDYGKKFITIDPDGSIDLDDGFNLCYPILDIIIACPVYFLDNNIILNKFKSAVSTRYGQKIEHLWGNKINSKASLLKNNKTVLQILSYDLETKNYNISFKLGSNSYQLTYDFVDNEVLKDENNNYNFLREWYSKLNEYFSFTNSHELIEEIMILANKLYTDFLCKNNLPVIYRKFILNHDYDNITLQQNIKHIFNQKKSDSAIYTLEKNNQEIMGCLYSHFTSPLRRLIDTLHQLIILKYIEGDIEYINEIKNNLKVNLTKINIRFEKIKRFHREYNLLKDNIELDMSKDYEGIVFNIYKNKIDVWCNEINRFIKVEFVNNNLLFQYQIIYNNNEWKIINKIDNKIIKYKIGDLINFKLNKKDSLLPSKNIIGLLKKIE